MKITAANLGKRFNREWIFRNLNYEFEAGTTYAVTGPNGSGKSTLLQILWGQVPPSSGTVNYHIDATPVATEFVYQHISIATPYMELIEEFTLREMISFHFKFKKIRKEIPTDGIADELGLSHALDKLIANFSSGMRQRLKLGLAMFSDTPVLFLDEPTTNLDKQSIAWYWHQIKRLPPGMTIFIASNQESEYPADAKKIDILSFKRVTTTQER